MTWRARLAAALLLASSAVCAQAGWWDDVAVARAVTADELRRDPEGWRDVVVVLDVRYVRVEDAPASPGARPAAGDWRVLRAFGADATDDSLSRVDPPLRLMLRRGSLDQARAATLFPGQRVQVRAVVREVIDGEARVELLAIVADGDPLTPEEQALVDRGARFLVHENPRAAEACFREVLARRKLPRAAAADVQRKLGAACWEQRRFAEAATAYAEALAADPADAVSAARFAAARQAIAAKPVEERASVAPTPPRHLLPPAGIISASPPGPPVARPRTQEVPPTEPPPPPKPTLAGPR